MHYVCPLQSVSLPSAPSSGFQIQTDGVMSLLTASMREQAGDALDPP